MSQQESSVQVQMIVYGVLDHSVTDPKLCITTGKKKVKDILGSNVDRSFRILAQS